MSKEIADTSGIRASYVSRLLRIGAERHGNDVGGAAKPTEDRPVESESMPRYQRLPTK